MASTGRRRATGVRHDLAPFPVAPKLHGCDDPWAWWTSHVADLSGLGQVSSTGPDVEETRSDRGLRWTPTDRPASRPGRLVVAICVLSSCTPAIDGTVSRLALPAMADDLGLGFVSLQWVRVRTPWPSPPSSCSVVP